MALTISRASYRFQAWATHEPAGHTEVPGIVGTRRYLDGRPKPPEELVERDRGRLALTQLTLRLPRTSSHRPRAARSCAGRSRSDAKASVFIPEAARTLPVHEWGCKRQGA